MPTNHPAVACPPKVQPVSSDVTAPLIGCSLHLHSPALHNLHNFHVHRFTIRADHWLLPDLVQEARSSALDEVVSAASVRLALILSRSVRSTLVHQFILRKPPNKFKVTRASERYDTRQSTASSRPCRDAHYFPRTGQSPLRCHV